MSLPCSSPSEDVAAEELERRALRLVLPGWETEPVAVRALHRREHRGSARVRALVEHLRAAYERSAGR